MPNKPKSSQIESFVLYFILNNLEKEKREEFTELVLKKDFEKIPVFLEENIPDFPGKIKKALEKRKKE